MNEHIDPGNSITKLFMDTTFENWRFAQTQSYTHELSIPGQESEQKRVRCAISDGPLCGPLQTKLAGDTRYLSKNDSLTADKRWVSHSTKLEELSGSMWQKTSSLL